MTKPWPFQRKALIGMVHVGALPGTPFSERSVRAIIDDAVKEARVLQDAGYDGVIVENMHDRPYALPPHDPAVTASMSRIVGAVRDVVKGPLGVQILSCGEKESLAVAHACGAQFIRCENFTFSHIADEGLLATASSGPLLRYRRAIGAESVLVLCDIKKKHASHAITSDVTLEEAAHSAEMFGADGVIVSGRFTGQATSASDVASAKKACHLPVLVGSGVTPQGVRGLFEHADALIVGTWIKELGGADGGPHWSRPVDPARARELVKAADAAR